MSTAGREPVRGRLAPSAVAGRPIGIAVVAESTPRPGRISRARLFSPV
ncbi:hypothetical protein [Embleya sp. NBC_00896]|nr:hypothetical protein OG928_07545 [Embleya sp. NBC_00896]